MQNMQISDLIFNDLIDLDARRVQGDIENNGRDTYTDDEYYGILTQLAHEIVKDDIENYASKDDFDFRALDKKPEDWVAIPFENLLEVDTNGALEQAIAREMSNIISIWGLPTNSFLYQALITYFDGHDNLLKHMRTPVEDDYDNMIWFVSGYGYDIISADLLGGSADGIAKKEFIEWCNAPKESNQNKVTIVSLSEDVYGTQHVYDSFATLSYEWQNGDDFPTTDSQIYSVTIGDNILYPNKLLFKLDNIAFNEFMETAEKVCYDADGYLCIFPNRDACKLTSKQKDTLKELASKHYLFNGVNITIEDNGALLVDVDDIGVCQTLR